MKAPKITPVHRNGNGTEFYVHINKTVRKLIWQSSNGRWGYMGAGGPCTTDTKEAAAEGAYQDWHRN